jgi:hypothetical protein
MKLLCIICIIRGVRQRNGGLCSAPGGAIALCECDLEDKPGNPIRDLANAGGTGSGSHSSPFLFALVFPQGTRCFMNAIQCS